MAEDTPAPKRTDRHRRRSIAWPIVFVFCAAVVTLVYWVYFSPSGPLGPNSTFPGVTIRSPDLPQLAELTGLDFPRGTRLLSSEWRSGLETDVRATMVMSPADAEAFLASVRERLVRDEDDTGGAEAEDGAREWGNGIDAKPGEVVVGHYEHGWRMGPYVRIQSIQQGSDACTVMLELHGG
jgi:hypothetical protein